MVNVHGEGCFAWMIHYLVGNLGRVCAGAGLACSPFRLTQGRPDGGVVWDSVLAILWGVGYDPIWLHQADCPGVVFV